GLALRFDLYIFYLRKQVKKAPVLEDNTIALDQDEKNGISGIPVETVKSRYFSANGGWGERFWTHSNAISMHAEGGRFPKPLFYSSMIGYMVGMVVTLG